jgi:putative ABC transport system permease protein
MGLYLAFKEVWRNRSKFFLFSLVIALITTLVLFTAALAEGLALANKEYLEKLDAQLLVFQNNVQLSTSASRLGRSILNDIARVPGVAEIGSIGLSSAVLEFGDGRPDVNVSLIGVEPGKPGDPPVRRGSQLETSRGSEVVIDRALTQKANIEIGDTIRLRVVQGTEEQRYSLQVIGVTDGQQYLFQPSIFVPYRTWDDIRPQQSSARLMELTANIVAVKLQDPSALKEMEQRLEASVKEIEVTDIRTAYSSQPGYSAQQGTLNTVQAFTLAIGLLVIGGFFQIQMLQKIPLIGVLKAIGTSNATVAVEVVAQIVLVTTFGVLLGSLATAGLALLMPMEVPVVFSGQSVALAIAALLAIGPLGGLVSVRLAIRVEPLIALGLSN